jgi:N-methylhydantoinase B
MTLDPIDLQVVTGALRAACEEMGATLIRAAHSANVKERHDCSCALFDAEGACVMQAEHIPVHLGSMPAAVEAVLGEDHRPGRSWILNDPYRGGTHLPDITVITPVFARGELLGFAAARAHHADVGSPTPAPCRPTRRRCATRASSSRRGSSTTRPVDELSARMRQPAQRRADLRAQLAATALGARRLVELEERIGTDGLREATRAVLDYAERRTRRCLAALPDGVRRPRTSWRPATARTSSCGLRATVRGDELELDFTGSAGADAAT